MSSMQQSFKAGQTEGQTHAETQEWIESGREAANTTRHNAFDATESAKESTHEAKQETSSFLQQTGEQMKNMAQGAVETVKNTLGMNDDKKN